jgi:hypothetical protein
VDSELVTVYYAVPFLQPSVCQSFTLERKREIALLIALEANSCEFTIEFLEFGATRIV